MPNMYIGNTQVTGINGESAYEIAVAHGYTGTEEEFSQLVLQESATLVRLGETNDVGGSSTGGSLMAKNNNIIESLSNIFTYVINNVATNSSILTSAVKSVQRGLTTGAVINISAVTPSKCQVKLYNSRLMELDFNGSSIGEPEAVLGATVISLSSTVLTISQNRHIVDWSDYGGPYSVSWEITEYI